MKSSCFEVDTLNTESRSAMRDLASVKRELLQCKRDQIEFIHVHGLVVKWFLSGLPMQEVGGSIPISSSPREVR